MTTPTLYRILAVRPDDAYYHDAADLRDLVVADDPEGGPYKGHGLEQSDPHGASDYLGGQVRRLTSDPRWPSGHYFLAARFVEVTLSEPRPADRVHAGVTDVLVSEPPAKGDYRPTCHPDKVYLVACWADDENLPGVLVRTEDGEVLRDEYGFAYPARVGEPDVAVELLHVDATWRAVRRVEADARPPAPADAPPADALGYVEGEIAHLLTEAVDGGEYAAGLRRALRVVRSARGAL